MRVLVVDINFDYKNPIYRQFYNSFCYCMEVDYFGPGYVTREVLEQGIYNFLEKHDKYDAILMGTYFVCSTGEKETVFSDAYKIHRNVIPYYYVNDAYQCCEKIYQELLTIKGVLKIYICYRDWFILDIGECKLWQELLEHDFYIMGDPIEQMQKFTNSAIHKHKVLTNYAYSMIKGITERYIPISFLAIGSNEIFVRSFSERKFDWCVPGNRSEYFYPERSKAYELIKGQHKSVWSDDPYQNLTVHTIEKNHMEWYQFRNTFERMLSWIWGKNLNIASHPKVQYIAACREQYLESMRETKYVYAEGGVGNCRVRKYFETCACGAVLVAKRVPGMKEMGFINGKNCFILDRYENITTIGNHDSDCEKIAREGQKLILDKHMFYHRAIALHKTIEFIIRGAYKGGYWECGDYLLK